jgi:flagellar biosynthesis protein FlhA
MAANPTQSGVPQGGLTWKGLVRSPDLIVATVVVGTILIMFIPLPPLIIDFLLAVSLALSLLILLVSVYITKPLDFAVFPTVLLISTLYRLALNVLTTRSILLHGGEGEGAASHLIHAFGNLVIGGKFFVGLVVFIILMIINFMVITKGAGRVAEVAARFTLDAMPGKQMAIDAELNSGHINADEARKRRKNVEREADFYGAMDGASKFVRGDAIAGIIITAVNVIVGLLVGVIQYNMSFLNAAQTFTILAVGDGLISAIPALMISTAAGIIVTRATSEGNLGDEVYNQFRVHPKALYISSVLIFLLAMLPGFPKISFLSLSALLFFLGRKANQKMVNEKDSAVEAKEVEKRAEEKQDSIETMMKVDIVSVEVGHALVSLIDPEEDGEVVDRIQGIRKQFAQELGIVIPQVQLRDNLQLDPGQYVVHLKGNRLAGGNVMVDYFLAMDPGGVELPLNSGEPTTDPVYGLPAIWVHRRDKDEAVFRGYTVVNCATVLATHLTKILREHSSELLTRQDVQGLVERLKETNPKVVEEVLHPERLSLGDVVKVMQNLLREDVSIRDILSLFECMADHCKVIKNADILSEQCRKALGRGIVQKFLGEREELNVVTFDKVIEDTLTGGLNTADNGSQYLALNAQAAQSILQKLMQGIQVFESEGTQPVLVISAALRLTFQRLLTRYLPQVAVLSFDEIPTEIKVKNLLMIS